MIPEPSSPSSSALHVGRHSPLFTDPFTGSGWLLHATLYRIFIRYSAMRVSVAFLRSLGRMQAREVILRGTISGELVIGQKWVEDRHRYLLVAQLSRHPRPKGPPVLLHDVTLTAMTSDRWTLSGFEMVEGVDYAQTWLIKESFL